MAATVPDRSAGRPAATSARSVNDGPPLPLIVLSVLNMAWQGPEPKVPSRGAVVGDDSSGAVTVRFPVGRAADAGWDEPNVCIGSDPSRSTAARCGLMPICLLRSGRCAAGRVWSRWCGDDPVPGGARPGRLMAAIDDLTELVERAAAAERIALASKWKDRPEVEKTARRVRGNAEVQRTELATVVGTGKLSPRWAALSGDYVQLGAMQELSGDSP